MTDEALRVGCMDYDRTRPLFDGRATIEDFDVSVERALSCRRSSKACCGTELLMLPSWG